jgi:hypothetical protein
MIDEDLIDLFAGMAMQGYVSTEYFRGMPHRIVAEDAYRMAEAMVKEKENRLKQKEQSND